MELEEVATNPISDPTEGWLTYRGTGYTFLYPPSWKESSFGPTNNQLDALDTHVFAKTELGIDVDSLEVNYMVVIGKNPIITNDLSAYVSQTYRNQLIELTPSIIKANHVNVYSYPVESYDGDLIYFVEKEAGTYHKLSLTPYSPIKPYPSQKEIEATITQILSTFEFLNQKNGNHLLTYSGTNFTFDYPSIYTLTTTGESTIQLINTHTEPETIININIEPSSSTPQEYYQQLLSYKTLNSPAMNYSQTQLVQLNGIKISVKGTDYSEEYVVRKLPYLIIAQPHLLPINYSKEQLQEIEETIINILVSFKSTNQ